MKVDLLIENAYIFNPYFRKFIYGNAAVLGGRFIHIFHEKEPDLKSDRIIDAKGKYMIPGFIDIHMHIESSMITPSEFAKAVIKYGVTTIVSEPHEIANVFGIEGIYAMMNEGQESTTDIFYGIPSSVPSTSSEFETTGGKIGPNDVEELIKRKDILALGEVMNFKGLVQKNDSCIKDIIKLIKDNNPNVIIEGHCPNITGMDLSRYIYKGVDSDHTKQTVSSLREKIESGMFMEIQEKSINRENIDFIVSNNLFDRFAFVTDDVMADKLLEGHLDKIVRKAVSLGMPPEMAVYAATYTPSLRMGLKDRGSIAPGKIADFILLDDLDTLRINSIYKNGEEVDTVLQERSEKKFPEKFYNSVKLNRRTDSDLDVKAPIENGEVKCRIMNISSDSTLTRESFATMKVKDGRLEWEDEKSPYCLVGVFERYGKNGNRAFGLAKGSILKRGAVAATYAHDSHNLIVMGKSKKDILKAANWVIENSGGYCVADNGKIIASLRLPIGGILSEKSALEVGNDLKKIRESMQNLGYRNLNEIMSLSTLTLAVSPELKITDMGLIEVKSQKKMDLFC